MTKLLRSTRFVDGTNCLWVRECAGRDQVMFEMFARDADPDDDPLPYSVCLDREAWLRLCALEFVWMEDDQRPVDIFESVSFLEGDYSLTIEEEADRDSVAVSIRYETGSAHEVAAVSLTRSQWLHLTSLEYVDAQPEALRSAPTSETAH